MAFDDFQQLRVEVDGAGGLLCVTMQELRDLVGAGKLGVHVRREISDKLAAHGMGHFPEELPTYQTDEVRVYLLGSRLARLIEAVLDPSRQGDSELQQLGSDTAADVLQQVRRLVCNG